MTVVREPAVAGQFYPGDASELRTAMRVFFEDVRVLPSPAPKALIVPHAGYIYSGPVAATAYARLRSFSGPGKGAQSGVRRSSHRSGIDIAGMRYDQCLRSRARQNPHILEKHPHRGAELTGIPGVELSCNGGFPDHCHD